MQPINTLFQLGLLAYVLQMCSCSPVVPASILQQYEANRTSLLEADSKMAAWGNTPLGTWEKSLHQHILSIKQDKMDKSRTERKQYLYSQSFYKSKPLIESDEVFQIVKKMPKGCALHLHDIAITSIAWVLNQTLTKYKDSSWLCYDNNHMPILRTSKNNPNASSGETGCNTNKWQKVSQWHAEASDGADFLKQLELNISYMTTDPVESFPNGDRAWDKFNAYFAQILGLLFYAPLMRDYFTEALGQFMADGVQCMELRSQLYGFYELNGTTHDADWGLRMYREATAAFASQNPDFISAKIIFSGLRFKDKADIEKEVRDAIELRNKYPQDFLGYDLVGQEDPNQPLKFYEEALLQPKAQGKDLPYFFHAGETNWQGTQVDENLADAVLLGARRLGHAYALPKHPRLMALVKERGIAVEVNPISNQVLRLVDNLQNHAMAPLLADDFPVVISSDDPASWVSAPLSHDFYLALMTMAPRGAGLDFLKQMAFNSIKYSATDATARHAACNKWTASWTRFIQDVVKAKGLKTGAMGDDGVANMCSMLQTTGTGNVNLAVDNTDGGNNGGQTPKLSVALVALCALWQFLKF